MYILHTILVTYVLFTCLNTACLKCHVFWSNTLPWWQQQCLWGEQVPMFTTIWLTLLLVSYGLFVAFCSPGSVTSMWFNGGCFFFFLVLLFKRSRGGESPLKPSVFGDSPMLQQQACACLKATRRIICWTYSPWALGNDIGLQKFTGRSTCCCCDS